MDKSNSKAERTGQELPQITMARVELLLNPHQCAGSSLTPEEWLDILHRIVKLIRPFEKYFEGYQKIELFLLPKTNNFNQAEFDSWLGIWGIKKSSLGLPILDCWPEHPLAVYWLRDEGFRLLWGYFPSEAGLKSPTFGGPRTTEDVWSAVKSVDQMLLPILADNLISMMEDSLLAKQERIQPFARVTERLSAFRSRIGLGD